MNSIYKLRELPVACLSYERGPEELPLPRLIVESYASHNGLLGYNLDKRGTPHSDYKLVTYGKCSLRSQQLQHYTITSIDSDKSVYGRSSLRPPWLVGCATMEAAHKPVRRDAVLQNSRNEFLGEMATSLGNVMPLPSLEKWYSKNAPSRQAQCILAEAHLG
ncbi:hypothetical protein CEXT_377871 [Caerostris extrusa]|uniref:Uncharacterized protein n=1 Tax=Caerostris extrusa TaxID=172846 RepID=A0AAV4NQP9_CAEEX|nr:hypothetical protein CEXT_377871 [Caerostris extrusa]